MHPGPVGHRALIRGNRRRRREQQRFELYVIEICGQWPAHPGRAGPAEITADRSLAQPQALGNCPLRQLAGKPQSQTSRIWRIDTLSAGISFPCLFGKETNLPSVENCRRRGPLSPHFPLIPITESMISFDRNQ